MANYAIFIAVFAAGVIVGLLIGPAKERLLSESVDGWISGYRFANDRDWHSDPIINELAGRIARGETESQVDG
jgi:hypothetical protein